MAEKTRIVEPEETVVGRQQMGTRVSAARNQHATIEELLETVFYMQSVLRLYNEATS
jgi:hypothetical protein